MYSYELINNHYVVEIDDQKFLIDTGSPFSFWVSRPIKEITIDGNKYPLQNRPLNFNIDETNNLVGVIVDGFIGMDIISKTSLTIYFGGPDTEYLFIDEDSRLGCVTLYSNYIKMIDEILKEENTND